MATDRDLRKEVTDKIVSALQRGVMPWRQPWRSDEQQGFGLPINAITGKLYNGGNRLILLSAAMDAGYRDPRWLTFNQAKMLGGSVRKGEHGTPIEYWETRQFWKRKDIGYEYEDKPVQIVQPKVDRPSMLMLVDGREVKPQDVTVVAKGRRYTWRQAEQSLSTLVSKTHIVFNVEQCQGLEIEPIPQRPGPDFGKADAIVRGMQKDGVSLMHGGDQAFYNVQSDKVVMPHQHQFESQETYLGMLLHELGHATGHQKRNDRPMLNLFGTSEYAREELVAELTSAFVAAEIGIGFDDESHAAYIGAWLEVLGKDKHEIFRAAKEASKAADYMLERGREISIEAEKTQAVAPPRQPSRACEAGMEL